MSDQKKNDEQKADEQTTKERATWAVPEGLAGAARKGARVFAELALTAALARLPLPRTMRVPAARLATEIATWLATEAWDRLSGSARPYGS